MYTCVCYIYISYPLVCCISFSKHRFGRILSGGRRLFDVFGCRALPGERHGCFWSPRHYGRTDSTYRWELRRWRRESLANQVLRDPASFLDKESEIENFAALKWSSNHIFSAEPKYWASRTVDCIFKAIDLHLEVIAGHQKRPGKVCSGGSGTEMSRCPDDTKPWTGWLGWLRWLRWC